jgi:hypothetical protein
MWVVPNVPGLFDDEKVILTRLVSTLMRKTARNQLRRKYYDCHQTLRDLGISTPPNVRIGTVLGWPAKAVDAMVRRTMLDSWVASDGIDLAALGVENILDMNFFDRELPAALTSALIHSVVFGFVTAGSVGEPDAVIQFRSAEQATGEWDERARRLANALSVISTDDSGQPDALNLYLPNVVVMMRHDGNKWASDRVEHSLGVPVEAIPYRASLLRPLGSARISRPVMELTDAAVRTLVRTEIAAEFYNAPQRYVLGASEDAFKPAPIVEMSGTDLPHATSDGIQHYNRSGVPLTGWQILLGHLLNLTTDENGQMPQVGQFPQQSMEPNVAHFRMIAQTFAAETSIPLRSLGVVGDNPESAEAISEANKELELEIKHWQRASLSPALSRMLRLALTITHGGNPEDYQGIQPLWARPSSVSESGAADAVSKQVAALPWLAETEIVLRRLGYQDAEIVALLADKRHAEGVSAVDRLLTSTALGNRVSNGTPVE